MSRPRSAKLIVGIDLGTTHTVVAWCEPNAGAEPRQLDIPQLVSAAEVAPRRLLPSSLYAPLEGEQLEDLWGDRPWIIGEHAQQRGGEVPGRAVSSAKSWLSHAAVDRTAAILPWHATEEADEDVPRLSPVDASMRVLLHVRRAWDEAFADHRLAEQDVVLTVPASFDAAARQLTVQAAEQAGLRVRLLEEPQAAFYDYMRRGGDEALDRTLPRDAESAAVLVCDVGGGTTDLSLIRVGRGAGAGPFEVERIAVGRHLLLGGDNMDLALAHRCEQRLVPEGQRLGVRRFAQLVVACRSAKERLLGPEPPAELPIALAAAGSQLIGGTLRTSLGREEVIETVLEGFFPEVPLSAQRPVRRAGIVAFGLPYERDVAVTRHLAAFVTRQLAQARPSALLLNGGVFHSAALAERLSRTVAAWLLDLGDEHADPSPPGALIQLPLADPDTAVALGAVAYGLALRGLSTRIGGGSARAYFLGLGQADGVATTRGVCVLPRGAAEGAVHRAQERTFSLTLGRPVRFELYASDADARDASAPADGAGALVELDPGLHHRLPPLIATLPTGPEGQAGQVPVQVEAELSAVGTLELACVEQQDEGAGRRFALAFDLRAPAPEDDEDDEDGDPDGTDAARAPTRSPSTAPPRGRRTGPPLPGEVEQRYGKRFAQAREAIERVFGKRRKDVPEREVKRLVHNLEKILGERPSWTMGLARALFDVLWPKHRARRRSPHHERVFWSLGGFCLRPGFGDPRDAARTAGLAAQLDQGLAFPKEARTWPQFWIAWRRVAAGLDERMQEKLRDAIDPFLAPTEARLSKPKTFRNEAVHDMLDLGGSLERVPAARRRELGSWVLEQTWTDRDPRLWAAIGRIGARVPTYGSVHQVVPARAVERWLDHLLRERWDEIHTAVRAAVAMARVTDDRTRDVSPALRRQVEQRLQQLEVPAHFLRAVRENVPPTEEDRVAFYGEDLPVGLRLVDGE